MTTPTGGQPARQPVDHLADGIASAGVLVIVFGICTSRWWLAGIAASGLALAFVIDRIDRLARSIRRGR